MTYLLAVCPFSIAFLVFINSSVSFVVTDLIGIHDGEGDAVGTLGFADELLALVACPLWGVLSDRIGVRHVSGVIRSRIYVGHQKIRVTNGDPKQVCTIGYAIIALALVLFVQATNVYPQLLLGRLLFSLGGSAVSTMVTAVLPTVTGKAFRSQAYRASVSSELTITPERVRGISNDNAADSRTPEASPSARLSGFVGLFAGCGALVSLGVFLPLPARFEGLGLSPAEALQRSYYLVAVVALVTSGVSFIGLRNLPGEEEKGWHSLRSNSKDGDDSEEDTKLSCKLPYWKQLTTAMFLGFRNRSIGLGYIGGFVARASSVGISLFIPLAVNHYYRVSGLCDEDREPGPGSGLGGIKKACPQAYILASILTGVSQLIALIAAPAFGFLTDRSRRYNVPLLVAAFAGLVGYIAFAQLPNPQFKRPEGSFGVFIIMGLIGISQIGAIVCSLAVLSNGILRVSLDDEALPKIYDHAQEETDAADDRSDSGEGEPLLVGSVNRQLEHLSHLKGSIAGVYSLYGGAGILLLTKVGGVLFDQVSSGSPFYIMAAFNGILLVIGILCGILNQVAPVVEVSV